MSYPSAFIGGTLLLKSSLFDGWEQITVDTPYGRAFLRARGEFCFVNRHGLPPIPPHLINYRANIQALKDFGAERVISLNSVGSLDSALKPGNFIVPDDFIAFAPIPTFFEKEMKILVPELDRALARTVHGLCSKAGTEVRLGGIYIQTPGPRLETKAEIAMLRQYGDVVGMTMPSEATLCMELDIPYASLCSIDNYCNGILPTPLTREDFLAQVEQNMKIIEGFLATMLTDGFP
jgi:5'-methylthioadenosine phosphorylase